MTPASSVFSVVGSLAITSTDTDLYMTANSVPDGFIFTGDAGDIWEWGLQPVLLGIAGMSDSGGAYIDSGNSFI
jgi:hypothetical protein